MKLRFSLLRDSVASLAALHDPATHGSFIRRSTHGITALVVAALPWSVACSSEDPGSGGNKPSNGNEPALSFCGPADTCPPDTTGVDLTTPVSFRDDIYGPIFQQGCNSITCHSSQGTPRGGVWLGQLTGEPSEAMLESIIAGLVQPSATAPEMKNVEPGKPEESFLMLKIDGCQDHAGLSCTVQEGALCDTPCGDGMPQFDNPPDEIYPLTVEERHTIRAWIAQGAQNN